MNEDDLYADLAAFMADGLDVAEGDDGSIAVEAPPDADRANMLLRVLRHLHAEAASVEEVFSAEVMRLEAWRADRVRGIDRRIAAIQQALEGYMRALHRDDPKRKSYKLPNGTLKLRAARNQVLVTDADALLAWERRQLEREVAAILSDSAGARDDEELDLAARLVELVEKHRNYVRVKVEPARSELASLDAGPVVAESEAAQHHAVVLDGEPLPGVVIVKPKQATFGIDVA